LKPATWLHEGGIASNRLSSRSGEYFFGSSTDCPSSA